MGPAEAAFMHAYEQDAMMQHQWEAAAAAHGMQMAPPHEAASLPERDDIVATPQ